MSEHSIEELQRQFEAAKSRASAAQKAMSEAASRLGNARADELAAEMAAAGIYPGTVIKLDGKLFGYLG